MGQYISSSDGAKIYFEQSGTGDTALLFVHGWLGNSRWWDSQRDYFSGRYAVVQMDLAGHGNSDDRSLPSSQQYAQDIQAVANQIGQKKIILVGHSMSGAYVLEAAQSLPNVKALVIVDTLKNLDEIFTPQQAEEFMFQHYRKDFFNAVTQMLPQYLFANGTPNAVKERLTSEFLKVDPERAIRLLSPLYEFDAQEAAKKVKVPVRAINSDFSPTNPEANRKYFRDYDFVSMAGTGHYPMLENPGQFNELLENLLRGF